MTITNAQRATLVATLLVTIGILLWDYFLLKDNVPGNTISSAIRSASECLPIPLIFGIWMAHMFWYQSGLDDSPYKWVRLLMFALLIVGSWAWWESSEDRVRLWLSDHPEATISIGFVAGHWVWPQFTGSLGS